MQFRFFIIPLAVTLLLTLSARDASAQFKEEAFTQSYNSQADSLASQDTTDKLINFKEIGEGFVGKRQMRVGTAFAVSLLVPGTQQINNRQYWKLPIFYSGIVAGLTVGTIYHFNYQNSGSSSDELIRNLSFAGAGVFYYASLMDGVACFKTSKKRSAGKATIYSILCPGLGQIYNREYWKIPIYIGGMVGSAHFLATNSINYKRFRDIYREATEAGYTGPITADQAKYYRDEYRRYRDYSWLALGAFYLLQIIDANVFCYMQDFEVTDDLAVSVSPTIILPDTAYALNTSPAAGLSFGIRF